MLSGIENFSTFLIFIILFPRISGCKKSTATEKVLPEDYDRLIPPNKVVREPSQDPVNVEIKLSVLNVRAVKETDLTFTMDLFYHQHWIDKRFINRTEDRVVLDRDWNDRIWVPDTFFKQAISGEVSDIVFPAIYFIINRDGEVFMGARISVTFICKMQFQRYPHDVQRCNFDIQSLSNTEDVVQLHWKGVTIVDHITTIQYDVTSGELSDCSRTYEIGNFSCIRAGIVLTRRIGHFLIKKYIPSALIVLMSFVGFWIPTDSYPARIAIVVMSLLGLITQEIQTSGEINASYVVALNIWYIGCITFVFLALIEFAFAMLHFHKIAQNTTQSLYHRMNSMTNTRLSAQMNPDGGMCVIPCNQQDNSLKMNGLSVSTRRSEELNPNWAKILVQKLLSSQSRNQNRVDIVSRKIFPFSYTLFIIMYIFYIKFF